MSTKIFLTGATGYVGGTVLAQLLKHPKRSEFDITILVRSAEKTQAFEANFGVNKAVVGSHSDLEAIEGLAANADIVFHLSDSDSVPLIQAILKGQKTRFEKTGKKPILIHTSGSAVVADDARGKFLSDNIYDDTDVDSLKAIPAEALHRSVDLAILEADTSGYVNAHIVVPATIYGTPTHEIAKAGLSNIHSIQVPGLIKAALARGRAGVVGAGKSKWSASHVDDVASLYLLLNAVLEDPLLSHGWDGFYFVGDIEFSWYDLSRKIGEAMVTLGIATEAEPTEFDAVERAKFFLTEMFANVGLASNCRVRPTRGLALGWKPTHSIKDLWAFVQLEVESLSRS